MKVINKLLKRQFLFIFLSILSFSLPGFAVPFNPISGQATSFDKIISSVISFGAGFGAIYYYNKNTKGNSNGDALSGLLKFLKKSFNDGFNTISSIFYLISQGKFIEAGLKLLEASANFFSAILRAVQNHWQEILLGLVSIAGIALIFSIFAFPPILVAIIFIISLYLLYQYFTSTYSPILSEFDRETPWEEIDSGKLDETSQNLYNNIQDQIIADSIILLTGSKVPGRIKVKNNISIPREIKIENPKIPKISEKFEIPNRETYKLDFPENLADSIKILENPLLKEETKPQIENSKFLFSQEYQFKSTEKFKELKTQNSLQQEYKPIEKLDIHKLKPSENLFKESLNKDIQTPTKLERLKENMPEIYKRTENSIKKANFALQEITEDINKFNNDFSNLKRIEKLNELIEIKESLIFLKNIIELKYENINPNSDLYSKFVKYLNEFSNAIIKEDKSNFKGKGDKSNIKGYVAEIKNIKSVFLNKENLIDIKKTIELKINKKIKIGDKNIKINENVIKEIKRIREKETENIEFDIISETKDGELVFTEVKNVNWKSLPKKSFDEIKTQIESQLVFLKNIETNKKIKYRFISHEKIPENILKELNEFKSIYNIDIIVIDKVD